MYLVSPHQWMILNESFSYVICCTVRLQSTNKLCLCQVSRLCGALDDSENPVASEK